MSKKAFFCLIAIFCFLYVLNCLMPLCFGDDYLYSFTWQGLPMYVPLGENAVRISSWHDLILSQYSHYMTWSGRLVAHTIIQYFLWKGKDIFNIFNAFVGVIFILEIYWCVHKGKVSLNFECGMLFGIFFILWSFSPDFTPVFLWLTGACNYLWSSVLLLGFLIPFIQKYYLLKKIIHDNKVFNFVMTALGILAGWTNENSVCWIIVLLFVFICYCHYAGIVEIWMYTGLTGLIFGYGLLMFAPGNIIRLHSGHGDFVLQAQLLIQHLKIFFEVLIYQLLLWHFCFKSIYQLKYMKFQNEEMESAVKKEIRLAISLCIIAFGMSFIMLFSPEFPRRSGFLGTVPLVIAAGVLLRLQKENDIVLIKRNAREFLSFIGVSYFILTSIITFQYFYDMKLQTENLLSRVRDVQQNSADSILVVHPMRSATRIESCLSGFHIIENHLSVDEKRWENVAFARYYGIKEIKCTRNE